jgi:Tol biopolymer transport system component
MKARRMTMLVLSMLVGALLPFADSAPQAGDPGVRLRAAIQKEEVDGDLQGAIDLYGKIVADHGGNRAVAAEALLRLGGCHEKLGQAEARKAYERLLAEYPDQAEQAKAARQRLSVLAAPRAGGPVARRLHTGGSAHAISPDGRYVIYMDGKGNYRLDDLRTGKDTPVTDDNLGTTWRFSYAPVAISPDSRQVAYPRQVGDANELRVSALDGSGMRVLRRSPDTVGGVWATAWMPDGKRLIVVENDGFKNRRGLLDAAGGPVQYVDDGQSLEFEHWGVPSPDGRFIAFDVKERPEKESLDVFLYDVAAGRDIPVVSGPANDRVVGWSPSGRELLFVRSGASGRDVWSVAIENGKPEGEPRLVKKDLGNGEPLHLSRSGVLYQSLYKEDIDAFVTEFDLATGHVALPARSVNERREQSGSPRWSADGHSFVYLALDEAERRFALVIRSEASGIERRLPLPGGTPLSYPQWLAPSPDARSVVLEAFDQAPESASYGMFLVDPASGVIRRAAETYCDVSWSKGPIRLDPSWSPEGKALYYKCRARDAEGVFLVIRRNVETGAEQQAYRTSLYPGEMILSPDGARFAFKQHDPAAGKHSVLMSLDVASGETKELDRVPEFVSFQALAWTADSRRVLYCKKQAGGSELWWVPAGGGTPERLAPLGQSIFTLAMDPAGKRIAWTAKSTTSEIWALENLLSR